MNKLLQLAKELRGEYQLSDRAKERWQPMALKDGEAVSNEINILDVVGLGFDDDATVAKVKEKLIKADGEDVTVNINSPGGIMFEGAGIYNLLKQYEGRVKVKVLGIAASAASLIAMAGDEIEMDDFSFLMIHNCWNIGMGDRNEFRAMANAQEKFDRAAAKVYSDRLNISQSKIARMMDDETFIGKEDATDLGIQLCFSDNSGLLTTKEDTHFAVRKVDEVLARSGLSRKERRELINEIKGSKQDAATESKQDATQKELIQEMRALKNHISNYS